MSTNLDPAATARPFSARWWLWLALPLPVLLASYWGYHSAAVKWPATQPLQTEKQAEVNSQTLAESRVARPTSSSASGAKNPLPRQARQTAPGTPVAPAAASPAQPLVWPLWDFQLKLPVAVQTPPLTPPNWRLVGSSNDGQKWQLVILRQGKAEPEFYAVGQELPGHYKIEAISGEEVTLVQRGRRMVLSYIGY